jgi:hypothetical protein
MVFAISLPIAAASFAKTKEQKQADVRNNGHGDYIDDDLN